MSPKKEILAKAVVPGNGIIGDVFDPIGKSLDVAAQYEQKNIQFDSGYLDWSMRDPKNQTGKLTRILSEFQAILKDSLRGQNQHS